MARRIVLCFFLFAFFLGSPFLYKNITGGFRLNKLYVAKKTGEDSPPFSLEGPFSYVGRGVQCFVFASPDRRFVLKIFRSPRKRLFRFSYPKVEDALASYALAFDKMREETALLSIHLKRTQDKWPAVILQDRLGLSHRIELDRYCFVLQRYMQPLQEAVVHSCEKRVQSLADSYLQRMFSRTKKGICNRDGVLSRNFGCIGNEVFEMDVGSLAYEPSEAKEEFSRFALRMRKFLEQEGKVDLTFYDQRVEELVCEFAR